MTSLGALIDRTPPTRDRYVDFLRAFSIAVVVFGHWLLAVVIWEAGHISGDSALDLIPATRMLTWLLQVMPLFFFVGGFSHYKTAQAVTRAGGDYIDFLHGRVARLLRPTAVFIAVWLVLASVLDVAFDLPQAELRAATQLVGVPLWFLVVYLAVVAVTPAMLALHHRLRALVVFGMAAGVALVDVVRLSFDVPYVGLLNFALVWLFGHQLGFFYADGTFERLGNRLFATMATGGLAAMALLTTLGPYSTSMVGVSDGKVSNNSPPSICLIALTAWLVGVAMLVRPNVSRWLQRRRVWGSVIGLNSVIMTAFLWHFTALLVVVLIVYPLGWPQPDPGSGLWWALRPIWIAILTAFLAAFVALFGRFERSRGGRAALSASTTRRDSGTTVLSVKNACAVAGIVLLVIGMHAFAIAGFSGVASPGTHTPVELGLSPWQNALQLLVGWTLVSMAHLRSLTGRMDGRAHDKGPRHGVRAASPPSHSDRVSADGRRADRGTAGGQELQEVLRYVAGPSRG